MFLRLQLTKPIKESFTSLNDSTDPRVHHFGLVDVLQPSYVREDLC